MKPACLQCFKTIGVASRFKLFDYLKSKGKQTVSGLVKFLALRQPTVTFHLGLLQTAGLVRRQKVGREAYYQINRRCRHCSLFNN